MRANIAYRSYIKMTLEHVSREYPAKNDALVYFAKQKIWIQMLSKIAKAKYL